MVYVDRNSLGLHNPNLDKQFLENVDLWMEELRRRNLCVTLQDTYVSPKEQAKLWKSGHSDSDIDATIAFLDGLGCLVIAKYIREAVAPIGPCVTTILPGCSWNNWGVSLGYTVRHCNEDKDLGIYDPLYKTTIPRLAIKYGLYTAHRIAPMHSKPNIIQAYKTLLPTDMWSLQDINDKLKRGSL